MAEDKQQRDPIQAHKDRMAYLRRRMGQLGLSETVEVADLLDKACELEASARDGGTGAGRGTAPTVRLANFRRALQAVLSLDLGDGSVRIVTVDAEHERQLEMARRN